jgi:hypothetical protein
VGAVLSVGLMQWEAMRGSRGAALLAALAGAPCFAGLLFVSISRAGVVFLGLGLLLWAAGAARGRARWPVLGGLAVFALFLLVLFAAGENAVRDRLVRIATEAVSVQRTSEAGDLDFRLPISRDTWRMTTEAPWTGYGLGQFVAVFPQYRQDSARAARVLHPESDWLMVAAETGWPAVAVLLVVTGWFFVACWRGLDDADGMLRWGAASAVGAALAHGVIDVPWHRCSLGWLLLALAAVTVPPGRRVLAHPRLSRLLWGLAGGSMVAWAAVLGWEHRLDQGEQGRPALHGGRGTDDDLGRRFAPLGDVGLEGGDVRLDGFRADLVRLGQNEDERHLVFHQPLQELQIIVLWRQRGIHQGKDTLKVRPVRQVLHHRTAEPSPLRPLNPGVAVTRQIHQPPTPVHREEVQVLGMARSRRYPRQITLPHQKIQEG